MKTSVVAVANQKGGVGKTTTAINLAACLAERRRDVLLVDMDAQANATSGIGMRKEPGTSLYRPLVGEGQAVDFIQPTALERLYIIPSEIDLAGCEVEVARMDQYLHRLRRVLEPVVAQGKYHYLILDCSPSLGILTMNVLTAADSVIIPIQCEYYALEGLSVMTRLIDQLRSSGTNPGLKTEGIVMTMYDTRTNLSRQVVQEVVSHYGDLVYETLIPRSIRLSEAPSYGKPITTYNGLCTGAVAYRQLAREFMRRRGEADADAEAFPNPNKDAADGAFGFIAGGAA